MAAVTGYLPNLLGPVVISWDGVDQTARPTLNFKGGTLKDDSVNDRLDLDFGLHSSGALKIYNPAGTFYYTVTGSAIVANRTLTLPLLTAGDTVVCEAFTQTLTNKTLTSPVLTTPQINDTSADHQYVFAVSELAADRTVTLPLLTGADTFVFEAHTQTLTNKTLTSPTIGGTPVYTGTDANDTALTLGPIRLRKAQVQTTDATQTTLLSYTMVDESLAAFDVVVTAARRTNVTKGGRWKRSVVYRRTSAGAATIVGAIETGTDQETDAAWDVTIDTSTNAVRVRVTGAAATDINWTCEMRIQETLAT